MSNSLTGSPFDMSLARVKLVINNLSRAGIAVVLSATGVFAAFIVLGYWLWQLFLSVVDITSSSNSPYWLNQVGWAIIVFICLFFWYHL